MNPGTVIFTLLKNSASVGALIGDKIYPVIAPPAVAVPYAVYTEISQTPILTQDGPFDSEFNYDVMIYANQDSKAKQIAEAVKAALSWQTGTINTVGVERIRFESQSELDYDEDRKNFIITQQYNIRVQ